MNRPDPNRPQPARSIRQGRRRMAARRGMQRKARGARRGSAVRGAQGRLRQFRQASILAVAITGFLILVFNLNDLGVAQPADEPGRNGDGIMERVLPVQDVEEPGLPTGTEEQVPVTGAELGEASLHEARQTILLLWHGLLTHLPKILVALLALCLAWFVVAGVRWVMRKTIGQWEGSGGMIALAVILIWIVAIGVAVSVVAGDIRALIGSLGLVGLALSWSLQTPIESFTGWLLNSFKGYYKLGDRIQVGDVFGDVYKIDVITTTVWEIGAPFRQGFVMAEQPTGRLVTFPNNEILSGSIVNLTRDFPYVWDELNVPIANESEVRLAMEVIRKTAKELLGDRMRGPAQQYELILEKAGLTSGIPENPQVYVAYNESWMEVIVRYLVGASERRKWKSELTLCITEELNQAAYKNRIIPVYPRQQIQFIDASGIPRSARAVSDGPSFTPKET
jgi:small-conductance mechanosensitive channel